MKRVSCFLLLSAFLAVMFLFPMSALAIPNLGVAPSAGTGGIYNFPQGPGDPDYDEAYIKYFVGDNYLDWGTNNGFFLPESGGSLTVWYGGDTATEVLVATNSAAGDNFRFGGIDFDLKIADQNQIDGYTELSGAGDGDNSQYSFYAASLGSVDSNPSKWTPISDSPWDSGIYYMYTSLSYHKPLSLLQI